MRGRHHLDWTTRKSYRYYDVSPISQAWTRLVQDQAYEYGTEGGISLDVCSSFPDRECRWSEALPVMSPLLLVH